MILQETAGLKVGVSSRINEWLTKTPESNKAAAPKPSVSKPAITISSVGGFSPGAEVVTVLPQPAVVVFGGTLLHVLSWKLTEALWLLNPG